VSAERKQAGGGRTVNRSSKWITPEKRAAIYLRDGFACVYCGGTPRAVRAPYENANALAPGLQIDHVRPRSQGGTNGAHNLATVCDACNRSKCDLTIDEWITKTVRGKRAAIRALHFRLAEALATPLDLHAGKAFVGPRAARPLPEHKRAPRVREAGPF
jgi:5-methylcytosine-specific restriction endonuclease McrA